MSRSLRFACLLSLLCLAFPTAHADTILTFALTGDFGKSIQGAFAINTLLGKPTGTVSIDTTTGVIEALNLSFTAYGSAPYPPQNLISSNFIQVVPGWVEFETSWFSTEGTEPLEADEDILLPVGTLIGYAGGLICSDANPCPNTGGSSTVGYLDTWGDFVDGQLTLVPTPEPSSLNLLSTGALGLAGVMYRRFLPRRA